MYVEDVEDGVCSFYATPYTELLILLLMSKVSNTMNNWSKAQNTYKHVFAVYIKAVKDVEDRSNTTKGCNTIYVKDGKRAYTHIFAHNFLNIQPIFNPQKLRLRAFQPYCVY